MVESGGRDQPFQWTIAPANIGVDEKAPQGHDQHDHSRHQSALDTLRGTQTEEVDWNQTKQADDRVVDGMGTRADQEINLLRAVVKRMEAPQERNFVHQTMAPVESEITDHERGQSTQP